MEASRRRRNRSPGASRVTTFRPITLSAVKERSIKKKTENIFNVTESPIENSIPTLSAKDNQTILSEKPLTSSISKESSESSSEDDFVPDDAYFAAEETENSNAIMLPTPVVFNKKAAKKRQSLVRETPLNRKSEEFQVEPYQNKILENTNSSKKRKSVEFSVPQKKKQDAENNPAASNSRTRMQEMSRKKCSPYLVKGTKKQKKEVDEKRNQERNQSLDNKDISDILGLHSAIQAKRRNVTDLDICLRLLKKVIKEKNTRLVKNGKRCWKKEFNYFIDQVGLEFENYEDLAEEFYIENRKTMHIKAFTRDSRHHVMELQRENRQNEASVLVEEKELERKLKTDKDDLEAHMYINSLRDLLNRL
uniref:Uncharacterized protein n=1 Tax=Aplanochytrium stocchinoi TaxID=215587 RepID=A0A6S8FG56_9STRA